MIRITINNIPFEAFENETVLNAAKRAGFNIPTLCHRDGVPHYTSCMVCMVQEKQSGQFLPSCSSVVRENMDIDTTGTEVVALRQKALELLLSEHRAECEAPCKVVCPAGYNIPLMNRLLGDGRLEEARQLSLKQLNTADLWCFHCQGYCENACRRKKIDIPVSIKNLQIFASGKAGPETENPEKPARGRKEFMSLTGKIDDQEQKEWLKEAIPATPRHREIAGKEQAVEESLSCMHCDCRAAGDCRLRDLSNELAVKDPRGKIVNSPIVKKINSSANLIFENAKCIKCGLCVRIFGDRTNEPALCFINRGFISIISEPLTENFEDILKTRAGQVIEVCPTGALSWYKISPRDETD